MAVTERGYLAGAYMARAYLVPGYSEDLGMEVYTQTGDSPPLGVEHNAYIDSDAGLGVEHNAHIDGERDLGVEHNAYVDTNQGLGIEHRAEISTLEELGAEFNAYIDADSGLGVEQNVYIENVIYGLGVQFSSGRVYELSTQFLAGIYNTDKLRVLCEFPSRGTSGSNWTSNSTPAGDFDVLNLNDSIVEHYTRTEDGTTSGWVLTCDTEISNGTNIDTVALLNHNLSGGATVLMQMSNDPGWVTVGVSENLTYQKDNMVWVAPTLPPKDYRYVRFVISDNSNTDNFLRVGTIVFGRAFIFTQENFSLPLRLKRTSYSDKVFTEGHSTVTNTRGVKKKITLTFDNLKYTEQNYRNLESVFLVAKTDLKCLWIPIPDDDNPGRYAVFGKLQEIPEEEHNDLGPSADYVSLNLEVDEAL